MKRVISLIIILAMATTAILMALPAMAATPEGTAISSAADFAAMTSSGKYYLTKDITISAPYNGIFKGILDGNGKKIIIASGANVSPFNKIEGATAKKKCGSTVAISALAVACIIGMGLAIKKRTNTIKKQEDLTKR